MKKVAFVCVHNSCRSIMAEGFLRHLGKDVAISMSAGTEKYDKPKPMAIEVMTDLGIDMSFAKSKLIDTVPEDLDVLITMGCGVECPAVSARYREDWGLTDPSGGPKEDFIETRNLIEVKVKELIKRIQDGAFN